MIAENQLNIGTGFYTIPDIARILRLPYHKVNRWVNRYWDGELGRQFEYQYSWKIHNSKAVSFHTLVEFYVLYQLAEAGISTREALKAHKELSGFFQTMFPFAQKNILENIKTDGYKVYFHFNDNILSLDGSKQLNLSFLKVFYKKLEFDQELVAVRFWPLGKDKGVVIDPKRQFGQPVVGNTNIYPETIYQLYKAGEPINFIAFTYEIDEKLVQDAIDFCKVA